MTVHYKAAFGRESYKIKILLFGTFLIELFEYFFQKQKKKSICIIEQQTCSQPQIFIFLLDEMPCNDSHSMSSEGALNGAIDASTLQNGGCVLPSNCISAPDLGEELVRRVEICETNASVSYSSPQHSAEQHKDARIRSSVCDF